LRWKVLLCKTPKNPETNGYGRQKNFRKKEITITKTRKKLKRRNLQASPDIREISPMSVRFLRRVGFKKKSLEVGKEE